MFINDVNKKEEIRNIAIQYLKKYGIKHKDKNPRQLLQVVKSKRFFNVPLQNLENETVTLKNGQQLVVPKRLYEMCSFIFSNVQVEGIFRKEGSRSRQCEIKLLLDRSCPLGDSHHVIDIAVVLKRFLRELPEPLIPYSYHELFLRCSICEKKVEAILLSCLLLPPEHLNVLTLLMQFLNEVSSFSKYNKMDSNNLAIILGPNIFPINEKVAPKNKLMMTKTCDIIKIMIDNSKNIGVIPDHIIEQIGSLGSELEVVDKVKRRRSGSLTRIFSGLKKIVGNKPDEETMANTVTPDLLLTPSINSVKKSQEYNKTQRKRKLKEVETVQRRNGTRAILERRWSAITHATNFKRKKRNSLSELSSKELMMNDHITNQHSPSKPEYVKVSKSEYEEIKNRVSAIEKRISVELENVQSTILCDNTSSELNIIQNIQSAYEQTLVHSEKLSPRTDHLARRMSRELRIRALEPKMIRSPSARKIGNMRRRSRELDNRIGRNPSFQLKTEIKQSTPKLARCISSPAKTNIKYNTKDEKENLCNGYAKRTKSFQDKHKMTHFYNSTTHLTFNSSDNSTHWSTSDKSSFSDMEVDSQNKFFSNEELNRLDANFLTNAILTDVKQTDIRYNQDFLIDNVLNTRVYDDKVTFRRERGMKQSTPLRRNNNFKQKERSLRERRYAELKCMKRSKESDIFQEVVSKDLKKGADEGVCTPKHVIPHIKRPIVVKTPRRLCSTVQNSNRSTPLKGISVSKYYNE